MTASYGGRDLLDITEAVTAPRPRRRMNWRRIAVRAADALIMLAVFALAIAALVATP